MLGQTIHPRGGDRKVLTPSFHRGNYLRSFLLALLLLLPVNVLGQPNDFAVVQQVAVGRDLSSNEAQHKFTDDVVCALNKVNPRWGHLRKNPSQTQLHGHAEDAALYRVDSPGLSITVDFIGSAGAPNARPTWQVDEPRYSESDWLPPHNCGGPVVPAPTDPPPTPLPTPVVDLSAVVGRLDRLEAALAGVAAQLQTVGSTVGEIHDDAHQIGNMTAELLGRPFPNYTGKVLGFPVTIRPVNP